MPKAMMFRMAAVVPLILCFGIATSPLSSPRKRAGGRYPQGQSTASVVMGQSRTILPDGQILLLGGEGPDGPLATAILQDPQTGKTVSIQAKLIFARAWHTATLLPDGTVLIWGGIGQNGAVENQAELFDPSSQLFASVPSLSLTPRAYHTATLLTSGQVLFAGGVDATGLPIAKLELWDFESKQVNPLPMGLLTPRSRQTAALLADGTVLFWGGIDRAENPISYGEIFDPVTLAIRIQTSPIQPSTDAQPPELMQSIPLDDTTDVPLNVLVATRFSKPISVATANTSTVTLSAPSGPVPVNVVAAEAGMLAFVTPEQALQSNTVYTLTLNGLTDNAGESLPATTITYTTVNSDASGQTSGSGGANGNIGGGNDDSDGGINSPLRKLPALEAPKGVTALSGQVLKTNGAPLEHALLQIGSDEAFSDSTGRFLLKNVPSGHQVMVIDSTSANGRGRTFGIYKVGVDILSSQTNVLKYTIWMTPLDTQHVVTISSPTSSEVVVTTPSIPGLELHIPPNTVIRDIHGSAVTQLSITAISVSQPPFPLPNIQVPTFFTIQPGGAFIDVAGSTWPQGAQLYYPNLSHAPTGMQFDFWNYDPEQKGWYVYGEGHVTKDRQTITPDPGVEIYDFTGAMVSQPSNAPEPAPLPTNPTSGEPVDLQTGLFIYRKTDLQLPDVIPITLTRTYRQNDFVSRAFGVGTTFSYNMFMVGDNVDFPEGYTYQDLILPDGSRVHFDRTSPCLGTNGYCDFTNATYMATSTPTDFYGATIQVNIDSAGAVTWTLTKKDGTVYTFPDSTASMVPQAAAPVAMQDRYGNSLTFARDSNSNLTSITSPNGRWIQFAYDTDNRIIQAQDNSGRTARYTYDAGGRLSTVTDANGGVTTYTYDPNNNMLTITDPRGITYLTNQYDSNNRVIQQTQADGGIFQFIYTVNANGEITQTQATDPNGNIEQVSFNSDGYMVSDTKADGKPEQETVTYNRQAGSGLILSVTDALNRQTSLSYDTMGNVTSITRLAGTSSPATTLYSYESTFNQVTAITDPLGHTTAFSYGSEGNRIATTDPLGNTTATAYNSSGQPVSIADALGETSQFAYDSGDLVRTTDPLGRATTLYFDAVGRLISQTDALGQTTKNAYDPLNELTSMTDPHGNQTLFTYDGNGNLLTVTDANQHTTTYTYDSMDRVSTRKDPLANSESYQYDGMGNLTQFTDRRGKVTTYTYDGLNRKTFAGFGAQTGPSYESTISNTYDAGNRLTQAVDSVAGTISRNYDGLDDLLSEMTPQGAVSYTYDLASRRQSLTVAGQAEVNYSYDNANHLTQLVQGSATVFLAYDPANRRSSVTLPNGIVTSYSYDAASELTAINYQAAQGNLGNLAYTYDLAGRRTVATGSFARTGLPLPASTAEYNADNQLTEWGSASLYYDANGNMTSDGTNSYIWNAQNQLTSMDSNAYTFQYDGFGRRVGKTISGTTTNYLYDGTNAVQEISGSTVTANLLTGLGVDERFMRTDSSGTANFLTDALGSTLALTNSSGSSLTQYAYEPFGNTTVTSGSSTSSYEYTGRENDGTGLDFYRARYYSPTQQRFISEDPKGFQGGINLYAYTADSPINYVDPLGLDKNSCQQGCISWDSLPLNLQLQLDAMRLASQFTGVTYYMGVQATATLTGPGGFLSAGGSFSGSIGFATDPQGNVALITSLSGAGTIGTPGSSGGVQIGAATYQNVNGFAGPSHGWEASGGPGVVEGFGLSTNSSGTFTYATIGAGLGRAGDFSPSTVSNGLAVIPVIR
jgi:RHS repeat-associated protein